MAKVSGIYVIVNTKNGKVYVGQAVDFDKRWKIHKWELNGGFHGNHHLQAAWNKYGAKVFKFLKLEYCKIEQLEEREQHYLDIYDAKGIAYNIVKNVRAPRRGLQHSEETRRKCSEANKRRPPFSNETRRKMSESAKNRPRVSEETRLKMSAVGKGRKHSEETLRKMRESQKTRPPIPDETRRKMSVAAKTRKRTPVSLETRHKLSEASKGNRNHSFGKPLSDETRRKISDAMKTYRARQRAEREALANEQTET